MSEQELRVFEVTITLRNLAFREMNEVILSIPKVMRKMKLELDEGTRISFRPVPITTVDGVKSIKVEGFPVPGRAEEFRRKLRTQFILLTDETIEVQAVKIEPDTQ